jgi:hypothetical protein
MESQLSYGRDGRKHKRLSDNLLLFILILFAVTFGMVTLLDQFSDGEIPGVVHFDSLTLPPDIQDSPQSRTLPPAVGEPGATWQNCGIYAEATATENGLHTLAHGAVWITYQPELETADVRYLEEMLDGEKYVLLSPYPGQPSPIVVTAWGVQLELSSVTDTRLTQFIARYRLSPHAPESGATCVGGTGQPVK